MEELALGEMGMTSKELFRISPRSLFNKIYGFNRLSQEKWERTRLQTYHLLRPYFPKGDTIGPRDIMPFPWDGIINQIEKERDLEAEASANKIWARIDENKNRDVGQ